MSGAVAAAERLRETHVTETSVARGFGGNVLRRGFWPTAIVERVRTWGGGVTLRRRHLAIAGVSVAVLLSACPPEKTNPPPLDPAPTGDTKAPVPTAAPPTTQEASTGPLGGHADVPAAPTFGARCTRYVLAHFAAYTSTPLRKAFGSGWANGCWNYQFPRRDHESWKICRPRLQGNPRSKYDPDVQRAHKWWVYDETAWERPDDDASSLAECAAAGTAGHVYMAPTYNFQQGRWTWAQHTSRNAILYFAEIYQTKDVAPGRFVDPGAAQEWERRLAAAPNLPPMINVTPGVPMNDITRFVEYYCKVAKNSGAIGLYVGDRHGPVSDAAMHEIFDGLNRCTTAH